MARAILLSTQTRTLSLRVEASPIYDFLAALFVVHRHGPSLPFAVPRSWVRSARRALGPAMRQALARFMGPRAFLLSLVLLLDRRAPPETVPTFIGQVSELPPDELLLLLLTSTRGTHRARQVLREALVAEGTEREEALRQFARVFPQELGPESALALARSDPVRVRAELVQLLRHFYEAVYAQEEARVRPLLAEDAQRKRERLKRLAPEVFIEEATGGLVPDPGMVAEVVVAPSSFVRPYTLVVDHGGMRTYITPVQVDAREEDPAEVVQRVARALADATRLRILRLLADREMYVQQIAEAVGTSHVTALHHLAALRAARLVRAVERGNLKYYGLRPEGLQEVQAALTRLLAPEPREAR